MTEQTSPNLNNNITFTGDKGTDLAINIAGYVKKYDQLDQAGNITPFEPPISDNLTVVKLASPRIVRGQPVQQYVLIDNINLETVVLSKEQQLEDEDAGTRLKQQQYMPLDENPEQSVYIKRKSAS